ncbi:MAG: peptide/nickel transport system substrate-binding protein [Thermotogaceae bacterium]|nr:peptide/nickel transport system substrate-binding protein [Thermotogaceae bacterium]
MKKLNIVVVLVLVMSLLFGFTVFGAASRTPKDALVMAANTEIFISLDPAICYEVLPAVTLNALYDNLVGFKNVDEALVIQPELAEYWEISEDGMTYTFKLKDEAVFADGTEVLAEDVVWSYKRYLSLGSPSVWLLESIGINKDNMDEKIVEIDRKTLSMTFDAPYAENIVLGIMDNSWGGVINKDVALEHEVDGDMGNAWLTDHSAGAGQYVLDVWERNTMITMSANENYYGEKPNLKRIMMLEEVAKVDGVKVVQTPGHSNEYLAMNASWGPLQDKRVRQAIKYAINYDEIVDVIMAGELLTNNSQTRQDEAAKVQSDLKRVGIDAEIVIMQASQMYPKYRAQGHELIIAGWGNDYADADNLAMAMASYDAGQLAYRCAWDDDYADALAVAGRFETNPDKREQIYEDLTTYWHLNGPFAMFYQSVEYWGVREEVKNFYDSAYGYSMTFNWGGFAK